MVKLSCLFEQTQSKCTINISAYTNGKQTKPTKTKQIKLKGLKFVK